MNQLVRKGNSLGRVVLAKARAYSQTKHPITTNAKYDVGKTSYQRLFGRDLLSFDGYTRNDIFSLLWITAELKNLQSSELLCNGKRIGLIWNDPITKGSLAHASQQLKASLFSIHEEQLATFKNYEMLGRSLASAADVIFLDTSWDPNDVERFATGSPSPVITICSREYSPMLAYAELFTLFEKYGFLRRLVFSCIGPANNPMLNTYFTLLPTIGAHLRFFADGMVGTSYLEKGFKLAAKFNTEIHQVETVADSVYRAHVMSTCFHELPHMNLKIKDVKEMDLDWSFTQRDALKGLSVSKDFLTAKGHNLIYDVINNQHWIFQALVVGHTTDFSPSTLPPRFEGVV